MSNNKMKGLLKGLRYISQIFGNPQIPCLADNEKEPEMQIGHPTDVKHVAHIGWDGPSVNSPSWMTEFKPQEGFSSAPLGLTGDINGNPNEVQWVTEDGNRRDSRASNTRARDLPELPKSSRRQHSAGGAVESPTRGKSERTKQRRSKNSNRDSTDSPKGPRPARLSLDSSLAAAAASESPSRSLPDIPKKTRRKKSKEAYVGGSSSKQKPKAQSSSDQPQFISKSNDNELCHQPFDGEEKGFT